MSITYAAINQCNDKNKRLLVILPAACLRFRTRLDTSRCQIVQKIGFAARPQASRKDIKRHIRTQADHKTKLVKKPSAPSKKMFFHMIHA